MVNSIKLTMPIDQLINRIYNSTGGYYLSRTIGSERRLGDVGTYSKANGFNRIRTLDDYGISYEARRDENPADYEYTSEQGIEIKTSAEGEPAGIFESITEAEAGVRVEFKNKFTGVFSATGAVQPEISDKAKVVSAIKAERSQSRDQDYAVVTGVMNAESSTVLISNSSEAMVELQATGSVNLGGFSVADLSTGFELSDSSGMRTLQVAEPSNTPLFKLETITEDSDEGIIPLPFLDNAQRRASAERTPHMGAESISVLNESEAEQMLRPVKPNELMNTSGE